MRFNWDVRESKMERMVWCYVTMCLVMCKWADGLQHYLNLTAFGYTTSSSRPLTVGLTLVHGAASKGAVCLDGSLPGYHIHRGYGSGANSWLIQLEGGGWCNSVRNCVYRKKTRRGSSSYMEKWIAFEGILSNRAEENPDFYNWNRVKVRYCDGASFSGDSQHQAQQLYFRGQRIWSAVMEDLMSKGMHNANQALLSGCSAGGLAVVLHCDKFRELFPSSTRVKCLSDGGLFLDAADVSGWRTMRYMFAGVVNLHGVKNLPKTCTNRFNPSMCFFPHRLITRIKTPLFLLNAAYDIWQIQASLAPASADPHGHWSQCRNNYARCSQSQINFLHGFRNQMVTSVKAFSRSKKNGLFINSCFAHCQTERQDTWFGQNSPHIGNKGIAESVGNWYFGRASIDAIDCPYPCDGTCHHLVFQRHFTLTIPTNHCAITQKMHAKMYLHGVKQMKEERRIISQSRRKFSVVKCLSEITCSSSLHTYKSFIKETTFKQFYPVSFND